MRPVAGIVLEACARLGSGAPESRKISDLGQARLLESLIALMPGVAQGGVEPFFYRFSPPGELSAS